MNERRIKLEFSLNIDTSASPNLRIAPLKTYSMSLRTSHSISLDYNIERTKPKKASSKGLEPSTLS